MDDLKSPALIPQPKSSVGLKAVEQADQLFFAVRVNCQSRSSWVGPRHPGPTDECRLALSPKLEQSRKASRKQWCKGLRKADAIKRCCFSIGQLRGRRKIDTEPNCDPRTASFKQYSGQLLSCKHDVIGPFER